MSIEFSIPKHGTYPVEEGSELWFDLANLLGYTRGSEFEFQTHPFPFVGFVLDVLVSWQSKSQKHESLSSLEAKYEAYMRLLRN